MFAEWDKVEGWWRCPCGTVLPDAPHSNEGRGLVQCRQCGRWWRFGYWPLNRWPRDKGTTGLMPRRAMI